MYTFGISKLKFQDDTTIAPGNLTVLIGPNNAGKSRALKDILQKATLNVAFNPIVVTGVDFQKPENAAQLRDRYHILSGETRPGSTRFRGLKPNLCEIHTIDMPSNLVESKSFNMTPIGNPPRTVGREFEHSFGMLMIANLSTEGRLALLKRTRNNNNSSIENSLLYEIIAFTPPETRNQIRELCRRYFRTDIAFDYSALTELSVRIGANFGDVPTDPNAARAVLGHCEVLDDQGDGIRAFVGIISAILAVQRSVWLIDEPEAFLHPPQAFRIGEFIAKQATHDRQFFVATHSVDVLRGILSATSDFRVIRIDRNRNSNRCRILDQDGLRNLITDPLLVSSRVLDGLFYSGAIVTEADNDCRIYHSLALRHRKELDLHFVNAQNKQTAPRIASLYREMGVKCASIVDIDVLNRANEFSKQLVAAGVQSREQAKALECRRVIDASIPAPAKSRDLLELVTSLKRAASEMQDSLKSASDDLDQELSIASGVKELETILKGIELLAKKWNAVKKTGLNALNEEAKAAFKTVDGICCEHGLFINPAGELESLMVECGLPYWKDRDWIEAALKMIPKLEIDESILPWSFTKRVLDYLERGESIPHKISADSAGLAGV